MQKQVSKQSLAVIALSILLAIAMALTATFAAFSNQSTATGTIQFSGNVITNVTKTGLSTTTAAASGTNGVYTFTLDDLSTDATTAAALVDDLAVGLATGSDSAYIKVSIAMGANSLITINDADLTKDLDDDSTNDAITVSGVDYKKLSAGVWASQAKFAATDMVSVASFIKSIAVDKANVDGNTTETLTVIVYAQANEAFAA